DHLGETMPETLSAVQAAFLGMLQGLTEFLPISSSGHLILARHFLGWPEPPIAFDVVLHAGTAVALLAYLLRAWLKMLLHPSRLLLLLIVASIPVGIVGAVLGNSVENNLRAVWVIAATSIGWGLVLGLADTFGRKVKTERDITVGGALLIGVAQ